jgi:2-deoxy-D-gluconate 3-dehydrogenase
MTASAPPLDRLFDLSGKTAIVTGGAMGIGLAIARRLHESGANVMVADPDDRRSVAVEAFNDERDASAAGFGVDVSDEAMVQAMVAETVERFGSVDVLVNNAGVYPSCPMLDMDIELWRRVIDVNLTGLFLCTKAAAARMIERGTGGRIVNITSIDALHPSMVGLAHYDASKHGAWGFTKNVALELAPHGISVNAIAPGGIRTPGVGDVDEQTLAAFERMIPMGRMGEADEIGRAALFLASDLCAYTTGSQLVVDGGRLLS